MFDYAGNTEQDSIAIYRGEIGRLPEVFVRIDANGGLYEVTDPQSSIYGAEIMFPSGSITVDGAEAYLLISKPFDEPTRFHADIIEVGPAVEFILIGAGLVDGAIARVRIPYSSKLQRFFRAGDDELTLLGKYAPWFPWWPLDDVTFYPGQELAEGWSDRLMAFQVFNMTPGYQTTPVAGVPPESVSPFCNTQAWINPEKVGVECLIDQPIDCVCPPGAYGGPASRSDISFPTDVDLGEVGGQLVAAYNELNRSAIDFTILGSSEETHEGLIETDMQFDPLVAGYYTRYTAVTFTFDAQDGIVWYYAESQLQVVDPTTIEHLGTNIIRHAPNSPTSPEPEIIAGWQAESPGVEVYLRRVFDIEVAEDNSLWFATEVPLFDGFSAELRVMRLHYDGQQWNLLKLIHRYPFDPFEHLDISIGNVATNGQVLFVASSATSVIHAVNISQYFGTPDTVILGDPLGRRIEIQPNHKAIIAGILSAAGFCQNQPLETYGKIGIEIPLSCPRGVEVVNICEEGETSCPDRYLAISDTENQQLLIMSLEDLRVTRFAGTGDVGYKEGAALESLMNNPLKIGYFPGNDVFVFTDSDNNMIRRVYHDPDVDGVPTVLDNCPDVYNPYQDGQTQSDIDSDGLGDECDDDFDGDEVYNVIDNCPGDFNPRPFCEINEDCMFAGFFCVPVENLCIFQPDVDADMVGDVCDNCETTYNPSQQDWNNNGIGDACEPELDSDGIPNEDDNCPDVDNPVQEDYDNDGLGDACDEDVDGDGVTQGDGTNPCSHGIRENCDDNCPFNYNFSQLDHDGDLVGDECDDDIDGDGIPQGDGSNPCIGDNTVGCDDNCPMEINEFQYDADSDGVGDSCDGCPSTPNPRPVCVYHSDCRIAGLRCLYDRQVNSSGLCRGQEDQDYDRIPDLCDLCPIHFDPDNTDWVPDGTGDLSGDACTDSDGDGLWDLEEITAGQDCFLSDPASADGDGDGLSDVEEVTLGVDGYFTDPLDPDTDGDGCGDKEDIGDGSLCPVEGGSKGAMRGGGSNSPADELLDPPYFWVLEIEALYLRWESNDPGSPGEGYMHVTGGPQRTLVGPLDKDLVLSGQAIIGKEGDYGESETQFSDYEFTCPPKHTPQGDDCIEDCEWQKSTKNGIVPLAVIGEYKNEQWYFNIGTAIKTEDDTEHYLITYKEDPECPEHGTEDVEDISISYWLGDYALMSPSLPQSWLGTDHYSFNVPYTRLQKVKEIRGITLDFVDVRPNNPFSDRTGNVTVKGTVNLIPIYPELRDTPIDWLPGIPGDNSDDGKEKIEMKVKLYPEKIGDNEVKAKIRVTVYDRTQYAGYAMNAKYVHSNTDKNAKPDLLCEKEKNQDWECQEKVTECYCEKEIKGNDPEDDRKVVITSYDYAAYGKVKAEIVELIDPLAEPFEFEGSPSRGTIQSRPPDKEDYTTIPIDRGEGNSTPGNKIADNGWDAKGEAVSKPIDDVWPKAYDGENIYADIGDGIIAFEEYRGFMVEGIHRRTDPTYGDLFIWSETGLGYTTSLPVNVHLIYCDQKNLVDCEYNPAQHAGINTYCSGIDNHKHQCAARVFAIKGIPADPRDWGATFPGIGVPCEVEKSEVYFENLAAKADLCCVQHIICTEETTCSNDVLWGQLLGNTTAHEIGHFTDMDDCVWNAEPPEIPCNRWSIMTTRASVQEMVDNGVPSTYFHEDLVQFELQR